jgi:hypothetical protein
VARSVRLLGWIALAVVSILLIGVNLWFAVALITVLLIRAAGSIWGHARTRRRSVKVTTFVIGIFVVILLLLALPGSESPPRPAITAPAIEVPVSYAGTHNCSGKCTEWVVEHSLTVILSPERTQLTQRLEKELSDWTVTRRAAGDGGGVRLTFSRSGPTVETPIRWFPFRTTARSSPTRSVL